MTEKLVQEIPKIFKNIKMWRRNAYELIYNSSKRKY
jgi:hypothetical protein